MKNGSPIESEERRPPLSQNKLPKSIFLRAKKPALRPARVMFLKPICCCFENSKDSSKAFGI